MKTHSSILAWRIPRREEPGGLYSPGGRQDSDTTQWLTLSEMIKSYRVRVQVGVCSSFFLLYLLTSV